jgi:hypothetical protein
MRRFLSCIFIVAALAAAYEAGRRELGVDLLPPRVLALLEQGLGASSSRDATPRAIDAAAARSRLEQHLSALRTQREHLDQEQRLFALEERVLTRWGASGEADPATPRSTRARELRDRIATLDREIAAAQSEIDRAAGPSSGGATAPSLELRAAKVALHEERLARELAPSTR